MHIGEHYDDVSEGEKLIIPEDDIAPVLFKSDNGWTWHRLAYDPDDSDQDAAEFWETELFPRFKTNKEAFLSWCGSLFDANSPRVLCPWLYGEGASGKGTLAMFLMQCMGRAGTTVDPEHLSFDKFALEALEGKRFAFVDETPAKLPTSSKFKRLTGERIQLVNRKGQKAVPMRVDAKFMFASNQFPQIKSGKEFARRIMPVSFEAISGVVERNKEDVIKLMHKNAAYFWSKAMGEYRRNRELSNYDVSEIIEYQEDMNEIIDLWIQRNIKLDAISYFPTLTAIDGASR
jgi:phage/plasmid-associated DNA primase